MMDRLPYIDLPQSTFNSANTSRFDVSEKTFTYNAAPGSNATPVAFSLLLKGTPSFRESVVPTQSATSFTTPANLSSGMYAVLIFVEQVDTTQFENDGYVLLDKVLTDTTNAAPAALLVKPLTAADSNKTYTLATSRAMVFAVYNTTTGHEYFGSKKSSANSVTVTSPSFSSPSNGLAVLVTAAQRTATLTETSTMNSVSPPAGVTQRAQTNQVIGGADNASVNDTPLTETVIPGGTETNVGGNPSAGFTRVRAKHDGTFQVRNSAGAETTVGGAVSVASGVCTGQAGTATLTPVNGVSVTVPPGKKAMGVVIGTRTGTATTGSNAGYNVVVSQGAGGVCNLAWSYKRMTGSGAAEAAANYQADATTVAASTSFSFGGGAANNTATQALAHTATFYVENLSTTGATTVRLDQAGTNNFLGSAIFAIIT